MRRFLAVILMMSPVFAQTNVQRPHILGLAHVAFRVGDMAKTGAFYEKLLGFAEPFSLRDGNGKTTIAVVKVNDEQYVELLQGDAQNQGQLDHFALYTDDITAMRGHLLAQQVPILVDIHQGRVGNPFLTILDPDGHQVEILQYSPTSLTAQSQGNFMPVSRISNHITHVGIVVSPSESALRFYRDVLGFRELSRGGGGGRLPSWIDLQAPDGTDYIELVPFVGAPSQATLRAKNHFCLASSDVRKTVATLQTRATGGLSIPPITMQTGDNLPTRAYLYDPNGARVEIMEPLSSGTSPTQRPVRDR